MQTFITAFGTHLKGLRLKRGLTQEELAHRASIHVTYLSGIERGRRNPSLGGLYRIASALRVRVKDLFLFDESAT